MEEVNVLGDEEMIKGDVWKRSDEIINLYNSNFSRKEIAEKINCCEATVQRILKANGENITASERNKHLYSIGKLTPWCKGLNKKEDKRLRDAAKKLSNTRKRLFKEGTLKISPEFLEWNRVNRGKNNNERYGKEKAKEIKIKMSQSMKGRKFTEEHKKKLSNKRKEMFKKGGLPEFMGGEGEKNLQWQGGISFEPYGKEFNKKFKQSIKERDGCCMLCNISFEDLKLLKRKTHVHHVNYNKLLSIPQNCISLCNSCHSKTNMNRDHWINFFQSLLSERYNYVYGGNEIVVNLTN